MYLSTVQMVKIITYCTNKFFLIQYWCRILILTSNIHYIHSSHEQMKLKIHNHRFSTNSSLMQYYVIFQNIIIWCGLRRAGERVSPFLDDHIRLWCFGIEEFLFLWKMDTSCSKTWDIQRIYYLKTISSRRSHTRLHHRFFLSIPKWKPPLTRHEGLQQHISLQRKVSEIYLCLRYVKYKWIGSLEKY